MLSVMLSIMSRSISISISIDGSPVNVPFSFLIRNLTCSSPFPHDPQKSSEKRDPFSKGVRGGGEGEMERRPALGHYPSIGVNKSHVRWASAPSHQCVGVGINRISYHIMFDSPFSPSRFLNTRTGLTNGLDLT